MNLKRQSYVFITLASVIVAIALTAYGFVFEKVQDRTGRLLMAVETVKAVTHVRFLLMEVAIYHAPRSAQQWNRQTAALQRQLSAQVDMASEKINVVDKLRTNLIIISRLYGQLAEADPMMPGVKNELGSRLVDELFVDTQNVLDGGPLVWRMLSNPVADTTSHRRDQNRNGAGRGGESGVSPPSTGGQRNWRLVEQIRPDGRQYCAGASAHFWRHRGFACERKIQQCHFRDDTECAFTDRFQRRRGARESGRAGQFRLYTGADQDSVD